MNNLKIKNKETTNTLCEFFINILPELKDNLKSYPLDEFKPYNFDENDGLGQDADIVELQLIFADIVSFVENTTKDNQLKICRSLKQFKQQFSFKFEGYSINVYDELIGDFFYMINSLNSKTKEDCLKVMDKEVKLEYDKYLMNR
jgi:hypothetical protein